MGESDNQSAAEGASSERGAGHNGVIRALSDKVRSFLKGPNLPYLAAFIFILIYIYWDYLTFNKIFTGTDFLKHIVPFANFQSDCFHAGSMPFWNPYINLGYPWVDYYVSTIIFPAHFLLGTVARYNLYIGHYEHIFWLLTGGISMYYCAQRLKCSPMASFLAASALIFSSYVTAMMNWTSVGTSAATIPLMMLGYYRARDNETRFSLITTFAMALAITGVGIAATVYSFYCFSLYVVVDSIKNKRLVKGVSFLAVCFGFAALLALPKLVPMFLAMESSSRTSSFITNDKALGYISFYEFLSFLIPVKHYFSLFIGGLSALTFVYAAIRRKIFAFEPLLICAVISAVPLIMNMDGQYTALAMLVKKTLPMMRLMRLEFMYFTGMLVFLILFLAKIFGEFIDEGRASYKLAAAGITLGLTSFLFFYNFNVALHYKAYIAHMVFIISWTGLTFIPSNRARIKVAAIVLLTALEFSAVFARNNIDAPYKISDNQIYVDMRHQNNASQSMMDDSLVEQVWQERFTIDTLRPTIHESVKRPFIFRGDGFMFSTEMLNRKIFSVIFYNSSPRKEFQDLMSVRRAEEFDGLPVYGFVPDNNPTEDMNGVGFTGLTCESFDFSVTRSDGGTLFMRQMFDDRWKVEVDGKASDVIRFDGYFMGVRVPPGAHNIRFEFRYPLFWVMLAISITTFMGLILAPFVIKRLTKLRISDKTYHG